MIEYSDIEALARRTGNTMAAPQGLIHTRDISAELERDVQQRGRTFTAAEFDWAREGKRRLMTGPTKRPPRETIEDIAARRRAANPYGVQVSVYLPDGKLAITAAYGSGVTDAERRDLVLGSVPGAMPALRVVPASVVGQPDAFFDVLAVQGGDVIAYICERPVRLAIERASL